MAPARLLAFLAHPAHLVEADPGDGADQREPRDHREEQRHEVAVEGDPGEQHADDGIEQAEGDHVGATGAEVLHALSQHVAQIVDGDAPDAGMRQIGRCHGRYGSRSTRSACPRQRLRARPRTADCRWCLSFSPPNAPSLDARWLQPREDCSIAENSPLVRHKLASLRAADRDVASRPPFSGLRSRAAATSLIIGMWFCAADWAMVCREGSPSLHWQRGGVHGHRAGTRRRRRRLGAVSPAEPVVVDADRLELELYRPHARRSPSGSPDSSSPRSCCSWPTASSASAIARAPAPTTSPRAGGSNSG